VGEDKRSKKNSFTLGRTNHKKGKSREENLGLSAEKTSSIWAKDGREKEKPSFSIDKLQQAWGEQNKKNGESEKKNCKD